MQHSHLWQSAGIGAALLAGLLGITQTVPAQTPPAPPTRDLTVFNWEDSRLALPPGVTMTHAVGKTPSGEPLTRLTLVPTNTDQTVLTRVNLPRTATDHDLTCFFHKTDLGAGRHVAQFSEMAHGWDSGGVTYWGLNGDTTYQSRVPGQKDGWDWKVGFYRSTVGPPPYQFRGFQFHGREAKDMVGHAAITVEAGPVHISYTPDDARWLYADLQPKTILSRDGVLPPLTLRIANLGTQPRTFQLMARPVERSLSPITLPAVNLGTRTLAPGKIVEIPIRLPLARLGRYTIRYHAESPGAADTEEETVSVVNGYDAADGFRRWAARRQWFSVPSRHPGPLDVPKTGHIVLPTASNGLSLVPIFPVQSRGARPQVSLTRGIVAQSKAPLTVLNTQLSPAWLLGSQDREVQLFGDTRRQGLGGPTHLAFATAQGVRVLNRGETLDAQALLGMTQPWLLAWWQGSEGWQTFDVPCLVTLQRRPMGLSFTDRGVVLKFAGAAGAWAAMPLFGYAKLPQQSVWQKTPDAFRLPADWPQAQWQTWTWTDHIPPSVAARCAWWSRALTRFPYNVRETYQVNHATGSVDVHDAYDYIPLPNDWHTTPLTIAPLSPTLAVAQRGGFPLTVTGKLTDCAYPTLFGPYTAVENASDLRYSLHVGPYWMQTAAANLSPPADDTTPARRAQAELLGRGANISNDPQNQMWNWNDGNFVWYAQGSTAREPCETLGYAPAGAFRQDSKSWLQTRMLYTLLDPAHYQMDERHGIRHYIDGPGIGDFGAQDWGDAGKLGTDMIYDAYVYAYNTGDYQTIADKWDLITSLNSLPVSQSWAAQGRAAISEEGDQAPTQIALARLAYAVGDRETYAAAVYWLSRELVLHVVKEGALTRWRESFMPWNYPGVDPPTNTGSNLWGTNASWVDSGFHVTGRDDGQWAQFPTRQDDPDTLRFLSAYGTELPKRVVAAATLKDFKNNYAVYYDRANILRGDTAQAQADFVQGDPKVTPPSDYISLLAAAWREFPPRLETLIPPSTPAIADTDFAWNQMNYAAYGLVSQVQMPAGKLPTPQWFWWKSPAAAAGVEWGDHWTFGSMGPADKVPASIAAQDLNAVSTLYGFTLRPGSPLDRLPPPIRDAAQKAALSLPQQTALADTWEVQSSIPVLVAGPFADPGGGMTNALVHAPERAYLAGKLQPEDAYTDDAAPADPKAPAEALKPGGAVHWQKAALASTALDFLTLFPDDQAKTNMAAYVALWVKSPDEQTVMLGAGSDDGIKIWINGQVVHDHPGVRGGGMDEDKPTAHLKTGWNSVLVKVTQGSGGWNVNFRVATPEGLPIPGLEFRDSPP